MQNFPGRTPPDKYSHASKSPVQPSRRLTASSPMKRSDLLKTEITDSNSEARRGAASAFCAYLLWGVLPIYWKWIGNVDAVELIAHRMVWTMVCVTTLQLLRGRTTELRAAWSDRITRQTLLTSGTLLAVNWGIYIWAVGHDFIIEASLGYFLVPLVNAGLGRLLFAERLRRIQNVALALSGAGVGVLVWQAGTLPWIALSLATTWGAYGLIRKRSTLAAATGLAVETQIAAPVALIYLGWLAWSGAGAMGRVDGLTTALIIGTGVISTAPLVLFAHSARRLRLTTLGLLQYLTPTCQFLIGWLVYHEPFSTDQAVAFALIWLGLAVYANDAWRQGRRRQ